MSDSNYFLMLSLLGLTWKLRYLGPRTCPTFAISFIRAHKILKYLILQFPLSLNKQVPSYLAAASFGKLGNYSE